jgi:hypothetical protein
MSSSNFTVSAAVSEDSFSAVKNKGFLFLHQMFLENGWHLTKNEMEWISYTKAGHETAYFEIQLTKSEVHVCIPLKNSSYQYCTSFKNYFQASEYVEARFKEFVADGSI